MPFRMLPNTDASRLTALEACATKASTIATADRPYPAELQTRLETLLPQFRSDLGDTGTALSAQTAATSKATLDFVALQTVVSHFIQVLNLAIDRGIFPAEARGYYGLDVSSSVVPPLTAQGDVTLWAQRLITGEAARLDITPGSPEMGMPSAADVQAALTAYDASAKIQSTAKDALDSEQEDVAALRPAVDALILDLWDTIEFAHRKDPAPSLRRKCREWGITYITRPGETPDPEDGTPEPPANPPAV